MSVLLLLACLAGGDPDGTEAMMQSPHDRAVLIAGLDRAEAIAQREVLRGQLVQDRSPEVRSAAAAALGFVARDRDSIPTFAGALKTEADAAVLGRLVAVLAGFDDDEAAIEAVARFWFDHPESEVAADALSALAGADPRVVCPVLHRLEASDATRAREARQRCACGG